jgi:predicted transposase YbfD/YdcC
MGMNIRDLIDQIEARVTEPRRVKRGNFRHKLVDILVIGLCAVLSGANDFADMEAFAIERESFLKRFLELPRGIPDSDTFRRLFERLKEEEVSRCLSEWLVASREKARDIHIDGKTIRGSANAQHGAFHVVSAWASDTRLVLGDIVVGEKSNEIPAIPKLLDLVDVEGAVVTADAMGCQREIAKAIVKKKADYVLAVKGNQGTLHEDLRLFFARSQDTPKISMVEKRHGTVERRTYALETDLKDWFYPLKDWEGLKGIGMVTREYQQDGETKQETRFYITSLTNLERFSKSVRAHWSVENQLHWCLDVIFGEDASHVKRNHAPLNMNVLRKTALGILREAPFPKRISLAKRRYIAGLNPEKLLTMLLHPAPKSPQ